MSIDINSPTVLTQEDKAEFETHLMEVKAMLNKHRKRLKNFPELASDEEMRQIEKDYLEMIDRIKYAIEQCNKQMQ